jgi:response regulator of citrate/malate metabolism
VVRFYRYDIKNERSKRVILAALADAELQKILDATMYNSKSVNQIIRETNIPHTTAYRKIKWLVEEKLLSADEIELQMMVRNLDCFISY